MPTRSKLIKRLTIAAAAMAAVMLTAPVQAATLQIDFGAIPFGGTPSYSGTSLDQSTAFNFGGGLYVVNQIGAGDQSGLIAGDTISLTNPVYGSGSSGALSTALVKSWTVGAGTFTETLTSFIANRGTPNALTLTLAGTLVGPGGLSQAAFAVLTANQSGGPDSALNWSFTNTSSAIATPLPASLPLFISGLVGLGLFGWRRKRNAPTLAA
jgi:hypothetical protein